MKRIWIVTELFYPEETSTAYILTKIAQRLTEKYDVHIICGPKTYDKNSLVAENSKSQLLNSNIIIQRVSDTKLDKNKLLSRIIRFIILSWKLSYTLWKNLESNDSILIVTNPAPLLLIISLIKRIRKNKLYVLVHDVFPENTIPANIITSSDSLLYKILKKVFDFAYRQADTLIVLGRDMKEVMKKKLGANKRNTDIQIIENWAETDYIMPNKTKNLDMFLANPKIDVQYAGNIGRVQGLINFLHIIKSIENPCLRFSFWGEGACKQEMMKYVEEKKIHNVYFFKGYTRNEQSSVLNNCDIAIVLLAKGMYGLGVPSKSYNIMAAGKPILFIGDTNSEIALEIKDNKIGFCFESEDSKGICSFFQNLGEQKLSLLSEMGKRARCLAEEKYSAQKILDKFMQVI
ncbi:hypothetical protein B5F77_08550 [Parabacteroides sp. An277]|uniref:glycosyltransferase family 4 protein n=1 Tax=Parabacteroides sp. An277 TaxID=1965619 RepID=UPI000B38E51A|nr:glycosyltransferase family 4 protein [Parabacteroides sp. An277]OUO52388.1 hypothetical protein B5F77_08550 [Parabacteroides sp. An277]